MTLSKTVFVPIFLLQLLNAISHRDYLVTSVSYESKVAIMFCLETKLHKSCFRLADNLSAKLSTLLYRKCSFSSDANPGYQ